MDGLLLMLHRTLEHRVCWPSLSYAFLVALLLFSKAGARPCSSTISNGESEGHRSCLAPREWDWQDQQEALGPCLNTFLDVMMKRSAAIAARLPVGGS